MKIFQIIFALIFSICSADVLADGVTVNITVSNQFVGAVQLVNTYPSVSDFNPQPPATIQHGDVAKFIYGVPSFKSFALAKAAAISDCTDATCPWVSYQETLNSNGCKFYFRILSPTQLQAKAEKINYMKCTIPSCGGDSSCIINCTNNSCAVDFLINFAS